MSILLLLVEVEEDAITGDVKEDVITGFVEEDVITGVVILLEELDILGVKVAIDGARGFTTLENESHNN